MGQETNTAYENYREAAQRFEYFVLGLCVALVAYAGQTLQSRKFGFTPYALEIGAIVLLIFCVGLSLKRVEKIIAFHQSNLQLLQFIERRSALAKYLIEGGNRENLQTSEFWRPEDMKKQIAEFDKIIPQFETDLGDLNTVLKRLYMWRNWLLISGLTGFVVSKVLAPYF